MYVRKGEGILYPNEDVHFYDVYRIFGILYSWSSDSTRVYDFFVLVLAQFGLRNWLSDFHVYVFSSIDLIFHLLVIRIRWHEQSRYTASIFDINFFFKFFLEKLLKNIFFFHSFFSENCSEKIFSVSKIFLFRNFFLSFFLKNYSKKFLSSFSVWFFSKKLEILIEIKKYVKISAIVVALTFVWAAKFENSYKYKNA